MKSFRYWLKRNRRRRLWKNSIEYFSPAADRCRWPCESVRMRTRLPDAISVAKLPARGLLLHRCAISRSLSLSNMKSALLL